MNKKKILSIVEKDLSVNVPVVNPEHSVSHNIQAAHVRNYGDHITIVNQKGSSKTIIQPIRGKSIVPERKAIVTSPIKLLPRMIVPQKPIALLTGDVERIKDARGFDDMISFLTSFFMDPFMWLAGPNKNRDLWQKYINENFTPTYKILKEHWEKARKSFHNVNDLKTFYLVVAQIISDAANMSMALQWKVSDNALGKLNHYFVSEWADVGMADYFVGVFNDYFAKRISREDLNAHLGGNLSEVESFLGEKL